MTDEDLIMFIEDRINSGPEVGDLEEEIYMLRRTLRLIKHSLISRVNSKGK